MKATKNRGGGITRNGGIRDFAMNGGIPDLVKIWGGNRDLQPPAGTGLSRFSWQVTRISRLRRDRNLDYFAIFWRDSKYYPFHPSIWFFRLADPKPQFTKETEFKHKHLLRTSAFISPFLGIILPFNRLSIIRSILHLRLTSLLCHLFSSIPEILE